MTEVHKHSFRVAGGQPGPADGHPGDGFSKFSPPKAAATPAAGIDSGAAAGLIGSMLNSALSGEAGGAPGAAGAPAAELRARQTSEALIRSAAGNLTNNGLVIKVAKMALVGMIGGALYGAASATAEHQGILYELPHKTCAFDLDTHASQLFFKLSKYEHLQPSAYKAAVHYCDRLFLLERDLAKHPPADADIPIANACRFGVLANVMLLRNKSGNGVQRGEINLLKDEINKLTLAHLRRIHALCATLKT
jgi:hypothetical protein